MTQLASVFAYGARAPTQGIEYAMDEHERCCALWDSLVTIDRQAEARLWAAAALDDAEIAERQQALAALSASIDAGGGKDAKRDHKTMHRDQQRAVWAWAKTHKDEARAIDQERREAVKAARQEAAESTYWGNYNAVVARYEAGRASARQKGRKLRYHDWARDDGVLTVQIQRTTSGLGAAPDELQDGGVSVLQVGAVPADAYRRADGTPRAARDRARRCRVVVEMRIDREGNMLRLPVWMHRPLPPRARIKAAQITWRREGDRLRWQLCLTVSEPPPIAQSAGSRAEPVTLHWERVTGGMLVARCAGDDLVLPDRWMARMDRVDMLRGWLDQSRALMAEHAPQIMADHIAAAPELDLMATIASSPVPSHSHSPDDHDMAGVRAIADRAAMDGGVSAWMGAWRYVWRARLALWRRLVRQRREQQRLWAREQVRRRAWIEIDDTDLSRIARAAKTEPENADRHRACGHALRAEVIHQARKSGRHVTASGKVLSPLDAEKTSVWARRKSAKAERSQPTAESGVSAGPA